jgi:hypothetical protein
MILPIMAQACYGGNRGKSMKAREFAAFKRVAVAKSSLHSLTRSANSQLIKSLLTTVSKSADTQTSATPQGSKQAGDKNAIRPFHVNVAEVELTELRRRINATKWPERETVTDQSQGVQLATIQELARYWGTEYDWRKVEARLNGLAQFITEIDGLASTKELTSALAFF